MYRPRQFIAKATFRSKLGERFVLEFFQGHKSAGSSQTANTRGGVLGSGEGGAPGKTPGSEEEG